MTKVRVVEYSHFENKIWDIEYSEVVAIKHFKWLFPLVFKREWYPVFGTWVDRQVLPTGTTTKYKSLQEALNDKDKIEEALNPRYYY